MRPLITGMTRAGRGTRSGDRDLARVRPPGPARRGPVTGRWRRHLDGAGPAWSVRCVVSLAHFGGGHQRPYRPVLGEPEAQDPAAQPARDRVWMAAQLLEQHLGHVLPAAIYPWLRGDGEKVGGCPGGPAEYQRS